MMPILRKTPFVTVSVGTSPLQIVLRDPKRVGLIIINRSATTLALGRNAQISTTSTATIYLLQNEIFTLLAEEGDDATEAMWAIASATSTVQVVESVSE